jgi:hypothetical protein
LTNGYAWNAVSAFANCGRAVAFVRGSYVPIVLQKSPSSLCEIEICNDRIGPRAPLNRCCAFAPDLESMLRDKMLKILLQHNLPHPDISPGAC